jgi:hypothetical protein
MGIDDKNVLNTIQDTSNPKDKIARIEDATQR